MNELVQPLRQTQRWTWVLAILGLIGAFMAGFAGLVMIAVASTYNLDTPYAGWIYLLAVPFQVAYSLLLWRYARAVRRFVTNQTTDDLAAALRCQNSFWRFVGILSIVLMAVGGIFMLAAIVGFVRMWVR